MNMPLAAPSLETMAQQPQVNLADVGDVVINTPPAALSLGTMAPQLCHGRSVFAFIFEVVIIRYDKSST